MHVEVLPGLDTASSPIATHHIQPHTRPVLGICRFIEEYLTDRPGSYAICSANSSLFAWEAGEVEEARCAAFLSFGICLAARDVLEG